MRNLLKRRDSNFELLRIVSMMFIILYHLALYGDYQIGQGFTANDIAFLIFRSGGKLGVVLFVMITGYYMINIKKVKLRKLINLELQVLFYSIGLLVVFGMVGNMFISMEGLSRLLFPNLFKTYWFFSSYFILYLCIPYLNKLVFVLNRKEFQTLLVIGLVFLILVPSAIIYNRDITQGIYLFYYYLVGGYIRLFGKQIRGCKRYLLGFFCLYLFIVAITMYIYYLSSFNEALGPYIYSFSEINSILIFGCAICLFLFFKGLHFRENRGINLVASVSFGVYLFHDHIFMRDFLWKNIFSTTLISDGGNLLIWGLIVAVVVYLVGGILELGRQVLFKYFSGIVKKS